MKQLRDEFTKLESKAKHLEQRVNNDLLGSIKNSKILFLSDSHGRGWSECLRELLGRKFDIFSIVKPGAGFAGVVGDIESLVSDFGPGDHVVVLAGTNDDSSNYAIRSALEEARRSCQNTNLCLMTILYRYDDVRCNGLIFDANCWINRDYGQGKFSNLRILDVNRHVGLSDYTRHGLHFLFNGKRKLCRVLANELLRDKAVAGTKPSVSNSFRA